MKLPNDFQFSQGSLQDYVDCPRRFQLRYVERVAWPAIEAEPALENERYLQQGAAFHRLVHQHTLGMTPERLSSAVTDEDLRRWWRNYLENGPADLPTCRYPEVALSGPVGHGRETGPSTGREIGPSTGREIGPSTGREIGPSTGRLVAKYDLIGVDAGRRAVIVDWKTSRRRSRRKWLAERLQTRVYPYLLVRAGSHLNGGQPLEPEQVEMLYWFANFPGDPEHFSYNTARFEADGVYLASLVEEIKREIERPEGKDLPLTTQERRCRYCAYRSLCRRGVRAGLLDETEDEWELDDDFDISLDFEQIAEIDY